MDMNGRLCEFRTQNGTILVIVCPRIYLFYCTAARAMGALYPGIAGKPRGIADPALVTEPLLLGGFTAFRAEKIPDAHSE
jgi:hypothetical protein